jgi:hypothetical protein
VADAGVSQSTPDAGWSPPVCRDTRFDAKLFHYLTDEDRTNMGGFSAVNTADSFQRGKYLSKIHQNSDEAVAAIEAARKAGNPQLAEEIARAAFDERNALRAATQQKLSPGGRMMSEAIDQKRTWESMLTKYGSEADEFATAENIARASGRSNKVMSRLSTAGRVLGPIGTALGVGQAGYQIANAEEGDRARVAGKESGSLVGGAIGGTLGTLGALGIASLCGLTGPPGWLAAIGILGGVGGGFLGSEAGGGIGEQIGTGFGRAAEAPGNLYDAGNDWFTRTMSGRSSPWSPR